MPVWLKSKRVYIPALVVAGAGVVTYLLLYTGVISLPGVSLPGVSAQPEVQLEEAYENPFRVENQYVNPFDEYKSPFNSLQ
jgi:hypothetical protein